MKVFTVKYYKDTIQRCAKKKATVQKKTLCQKMSLEIKAFP